MIRRLTDIEIAARIVPTMLRWPSPEAAKTLAWDRLRDCVEELRAMLRALDVACQQIEQDRRLNPQDTKGQRIKLGEKAISELADFKPLHDAESAVSKNIGELETKTQILLRKALDELLEGVNAARRAVVERCQMRAVPELDVRFRG